MASEDLLKKAVAAFKALSPEQQTAMLEEQRQSWVRGNVGLSRDERGMTSPVMPRPAPAATDTGLVTIGEVSTVRESIAAFAGHMLSRQLKPGDLLCLRSQAEELLAAERAETERLADDYQAIREQLHRGWQECCALKADNAAERAEKERAKDDLTRALVHFVREHFPENTTFKPLDDLIGLITQFDNASTIAREYVSRIRSLEAKLAAAEKALEPFADHAKERAVDAPEWHDTDTVRIVVTIGDLRKSRAVLGGRP